MAKLRILLAGTAVLILSMVFFFCIHVHRNRHRIMIGAKNCTELHILGEVLAQLIERSTHLKVTRKFNLEGTSICFHALLSGTIDTYFEYTGTALLDILKQPLVSPPLYPFVKEQFRAKYGLEWMEPLGFCNRYALVVRENSPLQNISDLRNEKNLRVAIDAEFAARQELALLKKAYPGNWEMRLMDPVLLYVSLENSGVDVISGASTDGRLLTPHFKVLNDDRNCLPQYEVAAVISQKTLQNFPELRSVFSLLGGRFSEEQISKMNYEVEHLGRSIPRVAQEFLEGV